MTATHEKGTMANDGENGNGEESVNDIFSFEPGSLSRLI